MSKTTLQAHLSCSVQKRLKKNPNIRKMRTILKIGKTGQNKWAIGFAKCSFSVKN